MAQALGDMGRFKHVHAACRRAILADKGPVEIALLDATVARIGHEDMTVGAEVEAAWGGKLARPGPGSPEGSSTCSCSTVPLSPSCLRGMALHTAHPSPSLRMISGTRSARSATIGQSDATRPYS
jgi:hypothetical protein